MSKDKVGVAVAGLGFVGGQAHAPAVKRIPNANLVAVVDVIEDLAKKASEKYGVKYYTDFGKALKDPEIDALIVAVPTPFHYRLAAEALAAGKHVLLEIPMTPTVEEGEKLRDQAEKAGVILMPDLNFHFTPIYVKAKELISQNAIGQPIALTFSEYIAAKDLAQQWPAGSWAWDMKRSGGLPDYTLSFWSIDLARWLIGDVKEVSWMCNYAPLEGFVGFTGYNTVGALRFTNGAVGNMHYSSTVTRGEGSSRLEVFGNNTKALKAVWNTSLTLTGEGEEKKTWEFNEKGTRAWGHRQIDQYFVDCVLKGAKPSITPDDAIAVQRVAKKMAAQ
jgi:predicted dehydrogenase